MGKKMEQEMETGAGGGGGISGFKELKLSSCRS